MKVVELICREMRQEALADWAIKCFGPDSPRQRALRLLEEAVEAFQAVGGDEGQAVELLRFVFSKPPGEISQEIGGVAVTSILLANSLGLSADECEAREIARVLAKPHAHFTQRNEAKIAAGFFAE